MTRTSMDLTKYANPRQEILEVQMLIWKQAKTMVQEMLGEPWTLFEYRSSPKPALRVCINPQGKAAASLSRNRDGTLDARLPDYARSAQPSLWPSLITNQIRNNLIDQALRWLIRTSQIPHLHLLLMDSHCMRRIQNPIRTTVDAAIRDGIQEARIDGNPVRNAHSRTAARLERMVGSHLLDDETERLRQKLFCQDHRNLIWQYNHTRMNQRVFTRMLEEAPAVLLYHTQANIQTTGTGRIRFRNQDEVTRNVQERTGLQGAAWRRFTQAGSWMGSSHHTPEEEREQLQITFGALASANVPRAATEDLQTVSRMLTRHQDFQRASREGAWEHGDPLRAWVNIINRFLTRPDRQRQDGESLWSAADALLQHIRTQQPWGPCSSWEACLARSQRWHQELRMQHLRERDPGALTARWESLVGETKCRNITAQPITTGMDLQRLGQEMKNCIGTYWQRCMDGSTRVFSLHSQGELAGAGELSRNDGNWQTGQVEVRTNYQAEQRRADAQQAMTTLRDLYQEAWERWERWERAEAQGEPLSEGEPPV